MSLPEVILWQRLRAGQVDGLRFRRQHPIGPFILDFYCPEKRLAVEIDGVSHDGAAQADYDMRRTAWLKDRGIRVARFPAREVLSDEGLLSVLDTIAALNAPSGATRHLPRGAGEDRS